MTTRTTRRSLGGLLSVFALGASAGVQPSCGDTPSATQARQETAEAWAALRAYGEDRKEAFTQELQARIAVLDRQLDELKARSARSSTDSKADIEHELSSLQTKRTDLSSRLTDLKAASKEAWGKTRDATLDAFESLTDGINEAARKFGDS